MINTKTQKLLDAFINKPNSSLLLEGADADGVDDCTQYLKNKLLHDKYAGNMLTLSPDEKGTIGVDSIRELKNILATKSGDEQHITRIALIKHAKSMTIEAQNALLKILEETTQNTIIVIESEKKSDLLETITSRSQIIPILPLSKMQVDEYCVNAGIDKKLCNRAYAMSGGKSKILLDILHNSDSEHVNAIQRAKDFLMNDPYDRLIMQKEYTETEALRSLLENLQTVSSAGLHNTMSEKWKLALIEIQRCKELLAFNVNAKLVYLRLCVML